MTELLVRPVPRELIITPTLTKIKPPPTHAVNQPPGPRRPLRRRESRLTRQPPRNKRPLDLSQRIRIVLTYIPSRPERSSYGIHQPRPHRLQSLPPLPRHHELWPPHHRARLPRHHVQSS